MTQINNLIDTSLVSGSRLDYLDANNNVDRSHAFRVLGVDDMAGSDIVLPSDLHGQSHLQHCSNGVKALCAKYAVHPMGVALQEKGQEWADGVKLAAQQLGLSGVDGDGLDNVSGPKADSLKASVRKRLSDMDISLDDAQYEQALKTMLGSHGLHGAIDFEKQAGRIRSKGEQQVLLKDEDDLRGTRLNEGSQRILLAQIEDRLVQVFASAGDRDMSAAELELAFEHVDYDLGEPKDLLQLFNRAAFKLKDEADAARNVALSQLFDRFLTPEHFLSADDGSDDQISKLAANRKDLKAVMQELLKILESNPEDGAARSGLELLERFDTQMEAVAKQSLEKKVRAAQAEQVRLMYEQGSSVSGTFTLEVGPEFSLLSDRFSIGIKLGFKYDYSIKVPHPYGSISVSNTISPSLGVVGSVGHLTDSDKDSVTVSGSYSYKRSRIYDDPDQLVQGETGNILKKLLHYAKPSEVPKTGEGGFWNGVKSFGRKIWGGLKSVGYFFGNLKNKFRGMTAEECAVRQALNENAMLKATLREKGILTQFDGLKRSTANRKIFTQISTHSAGGGLELKKAFGKKAVVKAIDAQVSGNRVWTKTSKFKNYMSYLGDSERMLEEYLEEEYGQLDDKSPDRLKEEKSQYEQLLKTGAVASNDLLLGIAELEGEFQQFCEETHRDDLRSHIFKSPRTEPRATMMLQRAADNRGQFIRTLMTRCAALKLAYLKMPPTDDKNEMELRKTCHGLLQQLGQSLDSPPITLSRSNQKWMMHETKRRSVKSELVVSLKTTFNPVAVPNPGMPSSLFGNVNGESITLEPKLKVSIPHGTNGFYKTHNSASISFSVKGDLILKYGPQLIGNAIKAAQQYVATQDAGDDAISGGGSVGSWLAESLKDVASNLMADISNGNMKEMISKAMAKQTIVSNGHKVKMSDLFEFKASDSNIFTLTVNLTGTGDGGVRFCGMDISNTRAQDSSFGGKVPLTGGFALGGKAELSLKSTNSVLKTLGTNTFQPLCEAMYYVGESKLGKKRFALNHASALKTMADECFWVGSKLNVELNGFIRTVSKTCTDITESIASGKGKLKETLAKGNNIAKCALELLRKLRAMKGGDTFCNGSVVSVMKRDLEGLLVKLGEGRKLPAAVVQQSIRRQMNAIEAIPVAMDYSADAVMGLGYAMKMLDQEM